MSVKFGQFEIGDGHPCFITYEAGPTHSGVESAQELVRLAAAAGANAIKFQIVDPERLVADKKQPFSYAVLVDRETGMTEDITEPLYDILCRRALTKAEWKQVKATADEVGLAFFATATFLDEIDFLAELGCHSVKIASGDVSHHPLIRYAARTGMCLQLDTGNSTIGEIEAAVDIALQEGNSNIIIHQCPSGYPARLESINLRIIPTLKQMFQLPIAYSDHTPGCEMDVAAVALGANLVEKTITTDRTTRSIEHIYSLEPHEMARFVQTIREVEIALGAPRRLMSAAERQKSMAVRRSCFYARDVRQGEVLAPEMIEYRRPGYGIPPTSMELLIGKQVTVDRTAGSLIAWTDLGTAEGV